MSAFWCGKETVNKILAGIAFAQYNRHNYLQSYSLPASLNTGDLDKLTTLGKKMLGLNAKALMSRYDDELSNFIPEIESFKFSDQMPPDIYQLYKSVQCLIYQCSEGDIPEKSQLYSDLNKLLDQIAHTITTNSEKYENAKWS